MTRYTFEWGMAGLFAFPLALGLISADGLPGITLHIGPLYFSVGWRDA